MTQPNMSPPVLVSGLLWVSHDEVIVLNGLRAVKAQDRGELYIKFDAGAYAVFSLKPDYGNATALNRALKKEPL